MIDVIFYIGVMEKHALPLGDAGNRKRLTAGYSDPLPLINHDYLPEKRKE